MEDYKNCTRDLIRSALTKPAVRAALWDIFWNRDYQPYAQLTGENLDPPANWPLAERIRIYVRKDIASKVLSMDLGAAMLQDVPEPVDTYASLQRSLQPLQAIIPTGLGAPRGIALGPDGSLFVADTGNSRIVHLDSTGNVLHTWGIRTPENQIPPAPGHIPRAVGHSSGLRWQRVCG